MPIPMNELFETRNPTIQPEGSPAWNREIFERAYYRKNGPFAKVYQRLERGFSVLVHLPGNCMAAAAEVVKRANVGSGGTWTELGKPTETAKTFADVLRESVGLLPTITAWIKGERNTPPNVIFHNLDLLSNGQGGIDPSHEAKTALLYLIDSARSGVVLGLSDRDAGELPEPLRRPFAEEIRIDEIPIERFASLIPVTLGERLQTNAGVPDGAAWLIASRLRWTDPIRAVKIMHHVAKQTREGDLSNILGGIVNATRTVEFRNPEDIEDVANPNTGIPTGFEQETIALLQNNVIAPFQRWTRFIGSKEDCQSELRKLPPGAILYGPPGTGKTRLTQWMAKSIALPVRQVSAADLKRADWGLTEKLVKDLFRSARRAAPCVIVLDDADDLLPDRDNVQGAVASAERGIVNAFLQELQGFGERLAGVLVILTTNRFPELDRAAKERLLPIHLRIPYPLDRDQVNEIISTIERSYNFDLSEEGVRDGLLACFLGPLAPTTVAIGTPDGRYWLDDNLFSPRQIEAAMRLLVGDNGNRPTLKDVERMKSYLKRQHHEMRGE